MTGSVAYKKSNFAAKCILLNVCMVFFLAGGRTSYATTISLKKIFTPHWILEMKKNISFVFQILWASKIHRFEFNLKLFRETATLESLKECVTAQ